MKRVISNLAVFLLAGLIFPTFLPAGKIYLKDGSIELSNRIWETEHFVHFILIDTKNVEIRFAKNIIDKIEYNDGTVQTVTSLKNSFSAEPEKEVKKHPKNSDDPSPRKPSANSFLSEETKQKLLWENRGLIFYDPRRNKRFWARKDARFNSLEQAEEALSKQYNRPVPWIEKYMGEENELALIHQNLINQIEKEIAADSEKTHQTDSGKSIILETPIPEINRKNDNGGSPKVTPYKNEVKGLKFYDPRRPEKYWSSADEHHQTLKDAIASLARHYQVTPEWIESHMGATNELEDIHRQIQQSLQQQNKK